MTRRLLPLAAGGTDVGRVRRNNEDSLFLAPERGLLVVADGMGGHASGEIASRMAVDAIRNYFFPPGESGPRSLVGAYDDDFTEETNRLGSSVRLANRVVYEASRQDARWRGMGTTVVCALLNRGKLSVAHVGDSRLYLIRAGSIELLTDDHSVVAEQVRREFMSREEAQNSEMKHLLTRALGAESDVEVDLDELPLQRGDALVLCSDGLTNMVADETILSVVLAEKDPSTAVQTLIARANEAGGKDNVTVIVAHITEESGSSAMINFLSRFRR